MTVLGRPGAGDPGVEAVPRTLPDGREFVLGLDLDNVCGNYDKFFREFVAKEFGVPVTRLGEVTDWDYAKLDWGIRDRAHFEELHLAAVRAGMFRELEPMEGAIEGLWALSDAGIHIRVITHRLFIKGFHQVSASDTIGWLDHVNIPYRDFCMVANKPAVGADAYLDDGPHNIEKLRASGNTAIVFDWAYNRHLDGLRVRNWDEATELILGLAGA